MHRYDSRIFSWYGKGIFLDKTQFHKEQAEKFLDYMEKFHDRDVLSLFEQWAESKDFSEEDQRELFKLVLVLIRGKP